MITYYWPGRSELVPRDNEAGNRTAKKVLILKVAPVQCRHGGQSPRSWGV